MNGSEMTTGGWIFMIASWSIIIVVCVWALARSIMAKGEPGDGSAESQKP